MARMRDFQRGDLVLYATHHDGRAFVTAQSRVRAAAHERHRKQSEHPKLGQRDPAHALGTPGTSGRW
jgi:hypothetical protein